MTSTPAISPLDWTDDGQPRSRLFGDVYFSAEDGLAESRAVFLHGCGLPEAWAGRRRFVVGELGFGTGLNIAGLLQLWSQHRPPGATLHIFSIERFPVTAAEAARALAHWPELEAVSGLLVARWPGQAEAIHRVDLPELGAILDVAVMDVGQALAGWSGQADAWFLDGFAPSANPQMWTDQVLALVGARSSPGARAATFTVAGQVRRGLAAAGFAVEKRPGFGRKRERLEARLPGVAAVAGARRVAIVGGGIAGASAARAVRALGGEAVVVEAEGAGAGASGNPAALVTPRLDAGLGEAARLFAAAFARATRLFATVPGALISRGVLQLATGERDMQRFSRIAGSGLFEPDELVVVDAAAASERMREPVSAALDQRSAQVVDPYSILAAWTGPLTLRQAMSIVRDGAGWRLLDSQGHAILDADAVVLAAGLGSRRLAPDLRLSAVRGQASWAPGVTRAEPAAVFGGYVLQSPAGLLFGATHDRKDEDVSVRGADHARNLEVLSGGLPKLAEALSGLALEGRAALRAATPDNFPLAGALDDPGLFALTGFGSRGFSLAPLLAEHVAALALGAPSPLPRGQAELTAPGRFALRAARRGGS